MGYISVAETAKKWNVSERTVRNYCAHDKIPGAFLTGKTWNIPDSAQKPMRQSAGEENIYIWSKNNYQEVLTWKTEDFLWVVYRGIGEETIAGAQILTYSD